MITKVRQLKSRILILLKRIPEFLNEIQAMIDNDPSKLIKSIARDIGLTKSLINYEDH